MKIYLSDAVGQRAYMVYITIIITNPLPNLANKAKRKPAILLYETSYLQWRDVRKPDKSVLRYKNEISPVGSVSKGTGKDIKNSKKEWENGKIWQEQRTDKNFGCVNSVYFVLEDAETTRNAAVYCLQARNAPWMFGQ